MPMRRVGGGLFSSPSAERKNVLDISMSVCGRWRATARYGGPWQGSLPGLAVWGTLHLDGGWTVLEPLGRRDNPPDQRTSPSLPGDRPGAQKRKKRVCRFFRWHNTFSESRWIHTCGFSHCQRHREKQAGARPTVSRGFLQSEATTMAKDSDEAADRPWNGDKAGCLECQ